MSCPTQVACGHMLTAVLCEDGSVFFWYDDPGLNKPKLLHVPPDVVTEMNPYVPEEDLTKR